MAPPTTSSALPPPPLGKRPSDAPTSTPPPAAKKLRRDAPHAPLSPAAAALIPALVSPTTADEMEQFLETCVQWQANLSAASRAIDAKVAGLEQREVALVLDGLVARVELAEDAARREAELEALRAAAAQQEREAQRAMRRMQQQQEERDAFEALERRLLDDRVAELEVQLAQNKLREVEKDEEITKLRAEWDAHLAEHQRLEREAAALQEALDAAGLEAQALAEKLALARAQEETRAFEDVEKRLLEGRVEELGAQLAAQRSAAQAAESERQLRAKLAEGLEAAQMQLSVAEAEAAVKKNEVARLLNDKAALKKQAKTLAAELKRAAGDSDAYKTQLAEARATQQHVDAGELASLRLAVKTLREQEQVRADDDARREEEMERLAWKERTLTKQLAEAAAARDAAVSDAVAQLQKQHDQQMEEQQQQQRKRQRDASDAAKREEPAGESTGERVARLELERREILEFFRCYYEASETKCRQLMRELSQQEGDSGSSGTRGATLDTVSTPGRIP